MAVPEGYLAHDGDVHTPVAGADTDDTEVPDRAATDELWVQVTYDGNNVTVRTSKTTTFGAPCYSVAASAFGGLPGGRLGFHAVEGTVYVHSFAVESWDGQNWQPDARETFASGQDTLEHDAAGNLIYDGATTTPTTPGTAWRASAGPGAKAAC